MLEYGGNAGVSISKFKCEYCSNEWKTTFHSVDKFTGCPICSNTNRAENSRLTEKVIYERLEGRPLKILKYGGTVMSQSHFECTVCGYILSTSFDSVNHGHGCPKCVNVARVTEEECVKRLNGRSVQLVKYLGSTKEKSLFKCIPCGKEWLNSFNNVQAGQGCPSCTKYGFNPSKPAYLYVLLLDTPKGTCYGFGVTNDIKSRMKKHRKNLGAMIDQEYDTIYFDRGIDAVKIENRWKKSPHIVNINVEGFLTECVTVNLETTKMIFG